MRTAIIYEDKEILVCHKPAGFPVQTRKVGAGDMESELKNYLFREVRQAESGKVHTGGSSKVQTDRKNAEPYIGIVHRLDQPVEGLLVFARNSTSAVSLNKQMQTENFGKYYLAEVCGRFDEGYGTLTDYLIKNPKTSRAEIAERGRKDAKKAVLDYTVLEEKEDTSLLKIHLETGRFHQIRVQMAHAGCPIVGDTKYNPAFQRGRGYQKIHLCAYRLEFMHPRTEEKMEFEIEPEWI